MRFYRSRGFHCAISIPFQFCDCDCDCGDAVRPSARDGEDAKGGGNEAGERNEAAMEISDGGGIGGPYRTVVFSWCEKDRPPCQDGFGGLSRRDGREGATGSVVDPGWTGSGSETDAENGTG